MGHSNKIELKKIKRIYDEFTMVEKRIADFFMETSEKGELTAKNVADQLHVSEASLSRFAKKCGYKGFREFVFHMEGELKASAHKKPLDLYMSEVLDGYEEIFEKSYEIIDDLQIRRIAAFLLKREKVLIFGLSYSGFSAREFALKLIGLGKNSKAVTDSCYMETSSLLSDSKTVVFGISENNNSTDVIKAVKTAKRLGAVTVFLTSASTIELNDFSDEVLIIASYNMRFNISAQLPVLVMLDIIFNYFCNMKLILETDEFD